MDLLLFLFRSGLIGVLFSARFHLSPVPMDVSPPVWQIWWVQLLGGAALAAILGGAFFWWLKKVRDQKTIFEELVAQRTEDLRLANRQLENEIILRKRAEESLSKRATDELRASEVRFRAMFENSAIGMALMGFDRRPWAVNDALAKMSGYSIDELLQTSGDVLTYEEDRQIGMEEFRQLLAGERESFQVEKRYVCKDGRIYWVRLTSSIVRDAQGKPPYIAVMIEDIDENKRNQEGLRKSEARFRAMFDNMAVGIAVMSLDRHILAVNQTVERITGYTDEEMHDIDPTNMIYTADRYMDRQLYQELVNGQRDQYLMEKRYLRKDGEIFWGRLTYSLVRDEAGKPEYLIGLIEDISEEKRAQEKLAAQASEYRRKLERRVEERTRELQQEMEQRQRAEQALADKAAEAAVVAERTRLARDLHDAVTQTLFSASLIAEVLPDLWKINQPEAFRRLDELRQLTRGALAEMRTLLVELRPNALVEIPLPDLLKQLCELLIGRARLPIHLDVEGKGKLPPNVQVGLYRITQEALNNVIKHAKATQVVVTLRMNDNVRLVVVDNGCGFDPVKVPPDHLGLKIMSERAEAFGASCSIYSEPGEGTQVSIIWQGNGEKGN